jgi:hypothetical protein
MESQQTQTIAEPPGLALYRIGVGHYFSRALALAAKLGVADCLKEIEAEAAIHITAGL